MVTENGNEQAEPAVSNLKIVDIDYRGISAKTRRFYNTVIRTNPDGTIFDIQYPYGNDAAKIRVHPKDFYARGTFTKRDVPLFGMDRFTPGQSESITICEGEEDAMAAFEMLGSKYPVVSVSSSSSALSDCKRARDFLNSFKRIYVCMDADEPGIKAASAIAGLFDVNKIYQVKLGRFKDANDYLLNGLTREFVSTWWNSKKYQPANIVSSYDDICGLLAARDNDALATYPFATLQQMSYGLRGGEVVLFTAPEKVGKTEVMRALEYHVLTTTKHNIGIIHLEEKEKRTVQGLLTYHMKVPVHLPDCLVSIEDQIQAYKEITGNDEDRVFYYTHFGSDDPDVILDSIRYLVAVSGCKIIFLDHITMLVTGFETDDERKKLDYISTRLAMMAVELNFCLVMVSHVNDQGETRGSRNIAKVANIIVHMSRNKETEDEFERNRIKLMVKGNRFAGSSGPAGTLVFDTETYTLSESVYNEPIQTPGVY